MSKPIPIIKNNSISNLSPIRFSKSSPDNIPNLSLQEGFQISNTPISKIYKWVDDDVTNNCFLCKETFTIFYRKHHCRCCGRIFCHYCSNYYIIIPDDYSMMHNLNNKISHRVCRTCNEGIIKHNNIKKQMQVFECIDLDINTLYSMRNICKTWKEYADFKLNKLRELQYSLPNYKYNNLEKKLLWSNRNYVISHPKYVVQLLRSIDLDNKQVNLIYDKLINNNKIISCKKMMCTRNCNKYNNISIEDLLNLLTPNISNNIIRKYAISQFYHLSIEELIYYLPFLVFNMRFDTISEISSFLLDMSIKRDDNQLVFCNELFWELSIIINQYINEKYSEIKKIYINFYDIFIEKIPVYIKNKLLESKKFVDIMEKLRNQKDIKLINKYLTSINIKNIVLPLHPDYECDSIDLQNLHIKSSCSAPIILPFICYKKSEPDKLFKYNILYKFEDIRKDQTVISMIKIIKSIFKQEENLDLDIITYRCRPTSISGGFIEIVPNSHTIRFIKENLNFTLLNYIIENNKNEMIDKLRNSFLKSCAIYCVITYIFGIGDRHLDNIMLTKNGGLFHIDYGYIMGHDPKPMTIPTMRIPSDMVDALGGIGSQYYMKFKELSNHMYSCLRRHINLFINMFSILTKTLPPLISSEEYLYDELIKRMIPGDSSKNAEFQLYNVIDNSSSRSLHYNIIDMFHIYNKSYFSNIYNSSKSYLKLFL
jgi:phosphatidylinositol 3-kinase